MKPKFHFIALFPEIIQAWLSTSILGRALERGVFSFALYQLRDFALDKNRTVDDVAYGGGGGMVLKPEPLVAAVESIWKKYGHSKVVCFSAKGRRLDTGYLESAGSVSNLILVCGHYEGIDQRFIEGWVDEEISIGDYVISGGELAALVYVDAWVRRLAGALGRETAATAESFSLREGRLRLLEYPHYTRPREFQGRVVPDVLFSGDHAAIHRWRMQQSRPVNS
jgi:tRNA (guanine37-N1)-methyltransferase